MNVKRVVASLAFFLTINGLTCVLQAQEITIFKKEGAPIRCTLSKVEANGDIWIKQGSITAKVKSSDYLYARINEKPEDLYAAEKTLAAKDFAKAAADFASLYEKYRFLGYDVLCIYGEASALAALGKKDDAIKKLKLLDKYELVDNKKAPEYYGAKKLLATLYVEQSKFDEALATLSELEQADDDDIASFGFNTKGDILLKQGKKKDAILMFMRTALLFPPENKERPRALLMIAKTLKELQDNRGEIFAEMLKTEYPGNPLVSELK